MKRLGLSLVLLALVAAPLRADILTLDDGTKIEGEIIKETEDEIELKIPHGSTKLPRGRVVKIEKKLSPTQEFEARRAKLDAKDAPGRIALAWWAIERHFPRDKAVELGVEAWRLEPGDESAIELLANKFDYHYEKDAWVEPDKWYPAHGYVRKGTGFITPEEQGLIDAGVLVKKLKALHVSAERAVHNAEAAIKGAPTREADAKKSLADADGKLKALVVQKETAKVALDARENDLRIAADKTVVAQHDFTTAQSDPCPADVQGKTVWDDRCRRAKIIYNQALIDEDRAKKARDAALVDFDRIGQREQLAISEGTAAKNRLDAVRAEAKKLEKALPDIKAARDAAAARVTEGVGLEETAKGNLERRKLQEVKDAADRLAALRALKKK